MTLSLLHALLLPGGAAFCAGLAAAAAGAEGPLAAAAAGLGAAAASGLAARAEPRAEPRAAPPAEPAPPPPAPPVPARPAPGELTPGIGRLLLERLPTGVVLVSATGSVLLMNGKARELFGRSAESGVPVEVLRAPRLLDAIDTVLASRVPEEVEFTLTRAKSLHLCAHVVSIAEDERLSAVADAPAVLVVLEDRTQARRAEELHRDFVANASHELKTPLAAVSGIIETLQGHAKGDAEAEARFLEIMAAQTERMKRLVRDLLSLNRIELNERVHPEEPQALLRLVGEAAESLRPLAEAEGTRLLVAPPADRPVVPGDRDELIQVFSNLIENALKYGRKGGEVRVETVEGGTGRPGMVGIAVSDDGPGIAREHLPRLTERFYRVSASSSRARGGTGLGLAIVKHVLYRHRGQLEIQSTPGQGSRFTVWLPLAGAPAASRPGAGVVVRPGRPAPEPAATG